MPYEISDSLVRVHGASKYKGAANRAFIHAFNSCHDKGGEEARCYRIAHKAAQGAGGPGPKKKKPMDGDGMVEGKHHDDA